VCSIEYLTTQIELVLPTFFKLLDRSQLIEYLTLGLLFSLWNTYRSTTAYLFDPPCTSSSTWNERCDSTSYPRLLHIKSNDYRNWWSKLYTVTRSLYFTTEKHRKSKWLCSNCYRLRIEIRPTALPSLLYHGNHPLTRKKIKLERSGGSKDRMETSRRTDATDFIILLANAASKNCHSVEAGKQLDLPNSEAQL